MITESYVTITCRCGHEADLMEFCSTPIGGELPRGHFQCPKCRRGWTTRTGQPRIGWSGMILPGKTEVGDLDPVL